jgi:cytochrome b pre-mRNA-processing protein 3
LARTLAAALLLSTLLRVAEAEGTLRFRRNSHRDAAARAYAGVVAQARRPVFFAACGVPDTLDGRFELVCLHAFLYLCRLKGEAGAAQVSQEFFDTMFADFDRSLREIGTGDLSVGRQVNRMAEAFYGRIQAYEDGLAGDDAALSAALSRNLYGTASATFEQIARVAAYMRREASRLAVEPAAPLVAGTIEFGAP